MRSKKYREAIVAFQNSHDFFEKNPWIDKYCFLTMFSGNAIPYQQMALNNMGICYLYIGENAKALDVFQRLAQINKKFPSILKTVEEMEKQTNKTQDH